MLVDLALLASNRSLVTQFLCLAYDEHDEDYMHIDFAHYMHEKLRVSPSLRESGKQSTDGRSMIVDTTFKYDIFVNQTSSFFQEMPTAQSVLLGNVSQ